MVGFGLLRRDHEDGTSQLFDFEWDQAGNRWLYVVPEKFRGPLLKHLDGFRPGLACPTATLLASCSR